MKMSCRHFLCLVCNEKVEFQINDPSLEEKLLTMFWIFCGHMKVDCECMEDFDFLTEPFPVCKNCLSALVELSRCHRKISSSKVKEEKISKIVAGLTLKIINTIQHTDAAAGSDDADLSPLLQNNVQVTGENGPVDDERPDPIIKVDRGEDDVTKVLERTRSKILSIRKSIYTAYNRAVIVDTIDPVAKKEKLEENIAETVDDPNFNTEENDNVNADVITIEDQDPLALATEQPEGDVEDGDGDDGRDKEEDDESMDEDQVAAKLFPDIIELDDDDDGHRQSLTIIKNKSENLDPVVKILRLRQEEIDAATTRSKEAVPSSTSIIRTNVVKKVLDMKESLSSDDDDDNNNFHWPSSESSPSSSPEISEEEEDEDFCEKDTSYDPVTERPRKPKKPSKSKGRAVKKEGKYKPKLNLDNLKCVEKIERNFPDWIKENLHCPICKKKVESVKHFIFHLFTHVTKRDGSQNLHCPVPGCSTIWPDRCRLAIHFRYHMIDQSHKCPACPQIFFRKEAQLLIHLDEVHPMQQLYICPICEATFLRTYTLKRHLCNVHGEKDDLLCSKECGASFKTKVRRTRHEKTCQGPRPKEFQCPSCPKLYRSKRRFEEHLQSHQEVTEGVSKFLKCKFEGCSKQFYQPSDFNRHQRTHTGEKPYICEQCGTGYSSRYHMQIHHATAHSGEKPYICDQCGRAFAARYLMKEHHSSVHLGVKRKPYVGKNLCSVCGKIFTTRKLLSLHMLSHSDQKKFPCSACQKIFKHPQSLRFHFRAQHKMSLIGYYVCKICGQSYSRPHQLKKHTQKDHPQKEQSLEVNPADHPEQNN